MKINHVLIDYENVQPKALDLLNQEHFQVLVFVGAHQTKISLETAAALQCLGSRARYIQISGNGVNSLDFHIAFYIGQLSAQHPDAYFHIISKDTGFDPLIQHLKTLKIRVCRSRDVTDIPLVKASTATSQSEKLAVIIANFQQRGTSKPRTVKTLTSTLNALFQKRLSDDELATLIQDLQQQGIITVEDTKVSYSLPHNQ